MNGGKGGLILKYKVKFFIEKAEEVEADSEDEAIKKAEQQLPNYWQNYSQIQPVTIKVQKVE